MPHSSSRRRATEPATHPYEDGPAPAIAQDEIAHLFAAEGPLAHAIAGYRVRSQQVEMARAVAQAIEERSALRVGRIARRLAIEVQHVEGAEHRAAGARAAPTGARAERGGSIGWHVTAVNPPKSPRSRHRCQ